MQLETNFATRLQGIIDRYNAGSSSADEYFFELLKFAQEMKAESERHVREGWSEDELELFDLSFFVESFRINQSLIRAYPLRGKSKN